MLEQENRRVECEVKSCRYHDSADYCRAEKIEVGPESDCSCCSDTFCKTYRAE